MKSLLSIDLGTSSLKAALFDEELQSLAETSVAYDTEYPAMGWAEQDAEQWWRALREAIRCVYASQGAPSPAELEFIAIDGMAPTLVPVDYKGRPLRKAIIWMDRRAEKEQRFIEERIGDRVFSIGGNLNNPSNIAPKIRWFKMNEPELYRQTDKFLSAHAYLVRRLTGQNSMDISLCGLSQLCGNPPGEWNDELIDGVGIDQEKLPKIHECTDIIGELIPEAADELGFSTRVKVIAGAMDNAAAVLGAGAIANSDLCISAGTASNVNFCATQANFSPNCLVYRHIIPGYWIHAGSVDYGGAGYKWFANIIGESDYAALDGRADRVKPGERPLIFLPYMVAQRAPLYNAHSRGVLFGLDPSMTDADLARAFMEGNALGIQKVIEMMQIQAAAPKKCRLTGGCARSRIYSQIFADVLGIDIIRISRIDTASLGIAMAAAKAAGYFDSYESMMDAVRINTIEKTSTENHYYYKKIYKIFDRIYTNLSTEFEALSSMTDFRR